MHFNYAAIVKTRVSVHGKHRPFAKAQVTFRLGARVFVAVQKQIRVQDDLRRLMELDLRPFYGQNITISVSDHILVKKIVIHELKKVK
jgi:hypothetical protein